MDKAVAYINKITNLYSLEPKIQSALLENTDKINKEFEQWSWEDIEYAIDYYYTRKSDRNYPKIVHIQAILNTNTHDKRVKMPTDARNYDGWYNPPSTKIKMIADAFLKVCRYAHESGVLNIPYFELVEKIPHGSDTYLKYMLSDRRDPRIWKVRWDWDDAVENAKSRFPDTFGKFKDLSKAEQYTFAYKLGMIKIGE